MSVVATIEVIGGDRVLEGAITGLALASVAQLENERLRAKIPRLYSGHIRYEREPPGQERWQTAYETARRGFGDCEDLASYRLAELYFFDGEDGARIKVLKISPVLRHVVVLRANGQIEDPSKLLGM